MNAPVAPIDATSNAPQHNANAVLLCFELQKDG